MFRRNSAGARGSTAQDPKGAQSLGAPETTKTAASETARTARPAEAGKGRPTPKRSEAERGRRQGITGSPGRPGSGRGGGGRAESKADRSRRYEAMKRGEEWALQARDRGPAKALARDYVDSRRRLSEYYMYVMVALIIVLFIKITAVQQFAEPIALVLILFVVVDALLLRNSLRKLMAQRLPGESMRGVTMYAVFRALQIRRMRMPAPRVRPGDKI
ncbi:MAG TPA: DUF3043 domain-containing protein [Streptosporangiaceae bacterium]|nr:DUF3043 domain-containing protein [Streptosporangiaceae bacterium]